MKTLRGLELKPTKASSCCGADAAAAPGRPELEEAARLFRALADETRLSILKQLRDQGEVCACDFVACCEVAQPTVSHHLKVLREAGLVTTQRTGTTICYSIAPGPLARLGALITEIAATAPSGAATPGTEPRPPSVT